MDNGIMLIPITKASPYFCIAN